MTVLSPLADASRYCLADARLLPAGDLAEAPRDRDGFARVDLVVDAGRIAATAPAGNKTFPDLPRVALAGRIVLPLFVDAHVHLDKGQIWRRAANPTGRFADALAAVEVDRPSHWSAEDVARRMDFGLRCAYAYGARAVRTHIDSVGPQTRISWPAFAAARERWRGRIELQGSPLFPIDRALDDAHMADVEAMVEAHGTRLLGAALFMTPRLAEAIERLFRLAERKGWDLDFHVDETHDPAACSLDLVAETAIARRFAGRVMVGHCCSLARRDEAAVERAIDLVVRAGLSVVSLPMCNLFLQDRGAGRTPRWRGVTVLHEFKAAGAPVMIASDNARDPFHAYGDLDMLEVWREGVRILHLDAPFADWAPAVSSAPARAMAIAPGDLVVGAPADMILTRARDFTELFSRPQADRVVLRAGRQIAAAPPDYSELDDLEGLAP